MGGASGGECRLNVVTSYPCCVERFGRLVKPKLSPSVLGRRAPTGQWGLPIVFVGTGERPSMEGGRTADSGRSLDPAGGSRSGPFDVRLADAPGDVTQAVVPIERGSGGGDDARRDDSREERGASRGRIRLRPDGPFRRAARQGPSAAEKPLCAPANGAQGRCSGKRGVPEEGLEPSRCVSTNGF